MAETDERIYPMTFTPVFRDYIWGGRNLERLYGRRLPNGVVAESWEISGHASSPTTVDSGYWQGRPLPEVLIELGADLVGSRSADMLARRRFPLLVKLLDANLDLSVQVHPDDAYAAAHEGGELGKTEMWYVLHAEPGAELIYGLAPGADRVRFRRAIETDALGLLLHRLPIAAGDSIFVPAGTVHALLAGAVVAEIQQNSDTTYRVYDWGRLGADGKPRPLHVDKALEVINWGCIAPNKAVPVTLAEDERAKRERLVSCPQFTVERLTLHNSASIEGRCDGSTFEIIGCGGGSWHLEWSSGALLLKAIRFALLPAALGAYNIHTTGAATTLLRAFV